MRADALLMAVPGCFAGVTLSQGLLGGLFMAGLIGGATHCVPMCGIFITALNGRVSPGRSPVLWPYHVGRIITYTALALLLYGVVGAVTLTAKARAGLTTGMLTLAAFFFLWAALAPLRHSVASPSHGCGHSCGKICLPPLGRLGLFKHGLLAGFIPCGLSLPALMAASSAPTATAAGAAMMAFGIGTLPALAGFGAGAGALFKKYPAFLNNSRLALHVAAGAWLLTLAYDSFK